MPHYHNQFRTGYFTGKFKASYDICIHDITGNADRKWLLEYKMTGECKIYEKDFLQN